MTNAFRLPSVVLVAIAACDWLAALPQPVRADEPAVRTFLEQHCYDCHLGEESEAKLDLSTLPLDLNSRENFSKWVLVHDRVQRGEMPPPDAPQPNVDDVHPFTNALASSLLAADEDRIAREGRAVQRRMNRYEYENTLRDLFSLPCLEVKDFLPEDGERYGFNKSGEALDVSHVQVARLLRQRSSRCGPPWRRRPNNRSPPRPAITPGTSLRSSTRIPYRSELRTGCWATTYCLWGNANGIRDTRRLKLRPRNRSKQPPSVRGRRWRWSSATTSRPKSISTISVPPSPAGII